MLSIPQYLDFAFTGKTKEICSFFLELLQRKNGALYLHSQQVANYAASVAAKLGLSRKEIGIIRTAALMHDIGLLSVPNSILNKFPYLSTREMAQYKRHCIAGCSMLENMEEFSGVIDLIRCHHEKWDGTGYPKRLKGVNIPLGARIISVADYYDRFVEAIAPGNTIKALPVYSKKGKKGKVKTAAAVLASAATKTAETEKIAETGEAKEYA